MSRHPADFGTALLEEVFTDMAENFFGARKQLENMMELFDTFVDGCRKKEKDVIVKAGFLNHLLLNQTGVRKFYENIRIDMMSILSACQFSENILPEHLPFSLTAKGEYTNMVLWAYNALQEACHEYMYGKYHYDQGREVVMPNYRLVEEMCTQINENVRKVNSNMPPGAVLQCVRKFTTDSEVNACIAGAAFSDADSKINEKLAFHRIDFNALNLTVYPDLPEEKEVSSKIVSFCKQYYSDHKAEIDRVISGLKKKHRKS